MSKHMCTVIVAAVSSLLLISTAEANVSFTITPVPLPFLAPEQNLKGFCACQIDAYTTDGSLISALDVNFEGRFHQRWRDIDFDAILDPTPTGAPATRRGDSHLTPLSGALFGRTPVENNNVFPSPLPDGDLDYGIGTFLRGAWGIPGASQSTTASVAYLVMPRDNLYFGLDYAVATSNRTVQGSFGPPLTFPDSLFCVPEPTTLCCLALLILIAGTRRSRHLSIADGQGVIS